MKATGIVRRIDDLGRVVVPKEIRRTLKIREGDPLEIYTEKEGEIVLKKYSPVGEIKGFASQYAESLASFVPHTVVITDRGQVVSVAGGGKELINQDITKQFEEILEDRMLICDYGKKIQVTENDNYSSWKAVQPMISQGDLIGAVVMISKDETTKISETELKMLEVAANFLGKQMES